MRTVLMLAGVCALALAACERADVAIERPDMSALESPSAAPSGPPRDVALAESDHPAASVNQVTLLSSGAKIYSTVGGDPAINGLYTFIARYGEAPEVTWRVFQIGDFNSWSVVDDRGDTVVLAVNRSWIDDNGDIQSADERMIVSVPDADDATITITPAS